MAASRILATQAACVIYSAFVVCEVCGGSNTSDGQRAARAAHNSPTKAGMARIDRPSDAAYRGFSLCAPAHRERADAGCDPLGILGGAA